MSIANLNAANFRRFIQSNKPVLVEFYAPWCEDCRRLEPVMKIVTEKYHKSVTFSAVNVDEEPGEEELEHIDVVPILRLNQNGTALDTIVAPESKAQLDTFLAKTLENHAREKNKDAHIYDMIVVGGGPGGYTAALYAARAGMNVVILEKLSAGGQMALTEQIDNYPGFENGINGFELGQKMRIGAERFGTESRTTEVCALDFSRPIKRVVTSDGILQGRTVVLATGAGPRELGVAGEKEAVGKGLSYCASCDGMFFKNKTVVVVGGGNSAAADALILSRICKKVFLVHRRDSLKATKIYHEPLNNADNLEFSWNNEVVGLRMEEKLTGVRLRNLKTGEENLIACDGVFVSIGRKPATNLVRDQLPLDQAGYIIADETTKTSIPGVFAVGDVRTKSVRQIVTAAADGAVAVHYAEEYLTEVD